MAPMTFLGLIFVRKISCLTTRRCVGVFLALPTFTFYLAYLYLYLHMHICIFRFFFLDFLGGKYCP